MIPAADLPGLRWRKSSYTANGGGNCVEVSELPADLAWRKSTFSANDGGNCVEVAAVDHTIAVRDSKNPTGPALTLTTHQWRAFVTASKAL